MNRSTQHPAAPPAAIFLRSHAQMIRPRMPCTTISPTPSRSSCKMSALGDWINTWSQQRTVGLRIDAETAAATPFPLQPVRSSSSSSCSSSSSSLVVSAPVLQPAERPNPPASASLGIVAPPLAESWCIYEKHSGIPKSEKLTIAQLRALLAASTITTLTKAWCTGMHIFCMNALWYTDGNSLILMNATLMLQCTQE